MAIKEINTIMTERIWINRVTSEIVFQACVTLINMACLEEVLEAEVQEVLSARTDFCYISDEPPESAEEVKARHKQGSTPASADNVSSQQRSDKAGYTTRTARERQFDRGEAHLLQARQAVNEERDTAQRLGRARSLRPQGHG